MCPDKPFHVSRTRRKELDEIKALFCGMNADEDVVRTVYLTGQPGSGKTELARQYGEQFKNATSPGNTSKSLVITLDAKTEESLLKSIKEVMQKLQPSIDMEPTHGLVILMKQLRDYLLGYNGAWLLVIDDMFENEFNHLLPQPGSKEWGGGQVLVTTQDNNLVQACHQAAKKLSLNEGMTREDALALLEEISGIKVDDFAEEIAKEFKNLPLSLACCATYVGEVRQDRASTEFGWKGYLEMYRKNECVQLESRTFSSNNVYSFSMAASAELAVRRMAETSDVLRLTFSFLSFCASMPVPLNVLARYVNENLPISNEKQATTKENAIFKIQNSISRCTLLNHGRSQNVETINCHQVIHRAFQSIQNTKPVEQQKIEFVEMMKSLNATLDFMDNTHKEDVVLKVLMRRHLQSFIDHANNMSWNDTAEFVLISMKNGQFLYSTSDMQEKKTLDTLQLLYSIALELDLSDQERCDILANLGFYYLELDRDEEALSFLCKAFYMTEGKRENEWLLLRCRITYNLARTYNSMDSVDLAITMMRRSIDLAKKVYIKEEDKIMNRFLWLATFYLCWKKIWKVGAVVEEAVEFFSCCTSESDTLCRASCLCQLADVCCFGIMESCIKIWKYRKYTTQVENFVEKSLSIYEQVLGADVWCCKEYCDLLVLSAILKARNSNLTEGRMQLEKALRCCHQNGDNFGYSCIVAFKTHLFDNYSSWWRSFCYRAQNLARGRLPFAAEMNILDDILEDYHRGRTSPSRRIIKSIEEGKNFLVLYNYLCYFHLIIFLFDFFCNI